MVKQGLKPKKIKKNYTETTYDGATPVNSPSEKRCNPY